MRTKNISQSGFTLVEMAMVILILGMVVGSVFSFLTVKQNEDRQLLTKQRQEKIATALTFYAQTNGRLPCPADQDVNEEDLGTARLGCSATTLKGVVPFRDLGLTRADIIDGYGHPFSYVVAPALAQNLVNDTNIHANCRIAAWIPTAVPPAPAAGNLNKPKARFCCQDISMAGGPLRVYNNRDASIFAMPVQNGLANTDNIDVQAPSAVPTNIVTYFAYVLVSHGQNGGGYFILPEGTKRFSLPKSFDSEGIAERQNRVDDSDMDYVSMPRNDASGDDHFDDIVLWRTQQSVMSGLNNDSCARP